jgi:hypothetical protein
MAIPLLARILAGLIALTGLSGLGVQLALSTGTLGSLGAALWGMARYYTNIGNMLVALILGLAALGWTYALRPWLIGGATINVALIGIVYALVLAGTRRPGESHIAMVLLHYVVPPLVAAYWLGCTRRGGLAWRDPLLWAIPPLAYFAYAIARAQFDGRYPYPFINVGLIGWPQTILNALIISAGFFGFGLMLVWLDRALARR